MCTESRTNVYNFLYLHTPRQWLRLSVSITIYRSSAFWALTRVAKDGGNPVDDVIIGCASLPHPMLLKVQQLLIDQESGGEAFQPSPFDGHGLRLQCNVPREIPPEAIATHLEALGFLDDLGCPRYSERNIIQIEAVEPPNRFISCIDGKLVYEFRLLRDVPSCELIYMIRVLHCMTTERVPGVARLFGIVVDGTGKQLRGYLLEYQEFNHRLNEISGNASVSWQSRERWAKQLVSIVSHVHCRGFVVGTLVNIPILLDRSNNVHIWMFYQKFHIRLNRCFPPEFRGFRDVDPNARDEQSPDRTSKSDIFQLGLLLWVLAEGSPWMNENALCIRETCNDRGPCEDASHMSETSLPPLAESIPSYYKQIINACRADCPNDRPAARTILAMFPPHSSDEPCDFELVKSEESHRSTYIRTNVGCDQCRRRFIQPVFHCTICNAGDFDICSTCFDNGIHCYDEEHLLVEMVQKDGRIIPGKYHSKPDETGQRRTIKP